MTLKEREDFMREFKSIVYQYSEIQSSNGRLKQLHAWDKNGTHEKAILKELDVKKAIQDKIKEMLKGHEYEHWKAISKTLTTLNSKITLALKQQKKAGIKLDELTSEFRQLNFKI